MKRRVNLMVDTYLHKKCKEFKINMSNCLEIGIRRMINEPYAFDYIEEKPLSAEEIVKKQSRVIGKLQLMLQDLNEKVKGGAT